MSIQKSLDYIPCSHPNQESTQTKVHTPEGDVIGEFMALTLGSGQCSGAKVQFSLDLTHQLVGSYLEVGLASTSVGLHD